ncbi:MAG: glycosyltransferase family 2 protein [Ignavibacteria bacterium]|nr:glycosyltransferase family 2 protein [Ignavibacteria bacterium]
MISEILFFVTFLLIVNSYLLYPILLMVLAKRNRSTELSESKLSVSILISAYNEEKVIKQRIENIESLDYDKELLEVIVGSDCSNDNTNQILTTLASTSPWLKIYIFENRRGKAAVINDLVQNATNNILVFSDANTIFDKMALKNLINKFWDDSVGGVSGKLILSDENVTTQSVEEKKYWMFETLIKQAEGKLGILIGANGGIFAIRKELFTSIPIRKAVTDDFFVSLSVLSKGYKFLFANDAIAYENVANDIAAEYKRKKRFAATNYQTLSFFKHLLFNNNLLLTYAFWSHKVLRWFLPFQLIIILILNMLLFSTGILFEIFFYFQVTLYTFALIGFLFSLIKVRFILFSLPYFFIVTNIALVSGFIKFLRKEHTVIWESTPR